MSKTNTQPYALTITGSKTEIFDIADALGFEGIISALSVSVFEVDDKTSYVQALYESENDAIKSIATLPVSDAAQMIVAQLPDEDWVSLSQSGLPPITAARFKLYGAHDVDSVDLNSHIGIQIDAGLAFGTGHHGTTSGCLILFDEWLNDKINEDNIPNLNILDLGCGAGTLAIAAAKVFNDRLVSNIIATDIDPDAVNVTRENAKLNKVGQYIKAQTASGLTHDIFMDKEFNLIFANILAAPLMGLAPDIAKALAPNGYVILSGILSEQKNTVAEHFISHGMNIISDCPMGEWVSLLAQKA